MAFAGYLLIQNMPDGVGFKDALYLAGKSGKLNVITTEFDWKDKYNIWSGLIGGFFLHCLTSGQTRVRLEDILLLRTIPMQKWACC